MHTHTLILCVALFFSFSAEDQTQGLTLARQALYTELHLQPLQCFFKSPIYLCIYLIYMQPQGQAGMGPLSIHCSVYSTYMYSAQQRIWLAHCNCIPSPVVLFIGFCGFIFN